MNNNLLNYTLQIADNALILGHRLSEWCGHGPVLEQDIAMTNMALDLVGQARSLYQYAAEVEGKGRTEDDFAYLRTETQYKNVLLVEQLNGHFGTTIGRQFLFDAYHYAFYKALANSRDETLAAIAQKSLKEVTYHLRFSSEWVIRLGDGTAESHQKIQEAINDLWMYTGELFEMSDADTAALNDGIGVDLSKVKLFWDEKVTEVLNIATIQKPESGWMQSGGKKGNHSEYMGYILTEMQYLQRTYPGQEW